MQTDEMQRLTPYQDVNDVIVFFSEHLKNGLGDNLVGFYLTGSLSYGNFVLGRSDLDFQAVVNTPLSPRELESVRQLHADMEERYQQWAKRIECSYLPVALLHEILPPKTSATVVGTRCILSRSALWQRVDHQPVSAIPPGHRPLGT